MAFGDRKSSGSRSSGRYGGGSSYSYDDGGRGTSKDFYEAFLRRWQDHNFTPEYLQEMEADFLFKFVDNAVDRYNIHDWAWQKFEDSESNDGRARRLVLQHTTLQDWQDFQARAKRVYDEKMAKRKAERMERDESQNAYWAAFRAERLERDRELAQIAKKEANLVAGAIQSDFLQAFQDTEDYGLEYGDFLDDPVAAHISRTGFGEVSTSASGVKLQITLSLDCSNSMLYNRSGDKKLSEVAGDAFKTIWLALETMKEEYADDLHIGAFYFAKNASEGAGKGASCQSHPYYSGDFRKSQLADGTLGGVVGDFVGTSPSYIFSGEDTWFYPLFTEIEKWENKHSVPGAYRLDLILTDAVIEHPSDIRRSDVIQERRDGALQTILLNMLPERDWVNSDLPLRCVQYPANIDNLGGLLRTIISEFTSAHM